MFHVRFWRESQWFGRGSLIESRILLSFIMQNGRQKEKEEEKKQREKNREEPELPAHEIDSFGRPLTFLLNHLIFWVVAVESHFLIMHVVGSWEFLDFVKGH